MRDQRYGNQGINLFFKRKLYLWVYRVTMPNRTHAVRIHMRNIAEISLGSRSFVAESGASLEHIVVSCVMMSDECPDADWAHALDLDNFIHNKRFHFLTSTRKSTSRPRTLRLSLINNKLKHHFPLT